MAKESEQNTLDDLLYAAASYAGKPELEEYRNADPSLSLSEKAKKRIIKRLRKEQKSMGHPEKYRHTRIYVKRTVIALLLLIALSFTVILSIKPLREPDPTWNRSLEKREHSIYVAYQASDRSIYRPKKIQDYRYPRAVREDFEHRIYLHTPSNFCIEYTNRTNTILYLQSLLEPDKTNGMNLWTSSKTKVSEVIINNTYTGTMRTNYFDDITYTALIWSDGVYRYYLSGNLPEEELLAIADSVS